MNDDFQTVGGWRQPAITLPASLADVEPVLRIRTPASMRYRYNPGSAPSRFLRGLKHKLLLGERCPDTGEVYIPPRGVSPTCGLPTTEQVECGPYGTITSFCIVHIGFGVNAPPTPFATALILPDHGSVSLYGPIQGIPLEDIRIGMRVEPVWVDDDQLETSFENIRWWRPIDEPDVDAALLKGHM